ncbi:CoA pyrophosphatase [Acidiferrimicrobium sp. IK]|uniref:NUDIX hydrolase n=1 Tax=Acidiferrimicrobium sp. IK TaxID=2871700 RepID=UPI0021CB368D|nr:CoA pyrophosphatase [Acidiferrimicrobium sp. IK]MCU4184998.1 CoA pyrophosphatase [Acidiferrimicrobium sp. IK]
MSDPAAAGSPPPAARGGPQRIPRPPGWRLGAGPEWARPDARRPGRVDVAMIRSALARPLPPTQDDATLPVELPSQSRRPAAVLCALYDDDGDAHVVLTRRSGRMRTHTGEVSFPGGRLEEGEEPLAAALREADEEIGLDPSLVEIVGQLSPLSTLTSRAGITPFVGVLPARPALRANPSEVEAVLLVPVVELWDPAVFHEELWPRPDAALHPVNFFDLVGDTVWGATGRMLRELLDRLWAAVG